MNYIENESTLRHLRKQHKDGSEVKIKEKAKKIWNKYVEDNKERLEKLEQQNIEVFDRSVDQEFIKLSMEN